MGLLPSISELSRKGFEALDRGDWKRALRLANKLTEKRNTAGREIAARALWNLGEADQAVEELRKGIATAPQIYIFYSFLGHFLSDLGRYDEALEALYRGKSLTTAPVGEFEYNIAIVRGRQGDYLAAFEIANSIRFSDLDFPAESVRFSRAYWLIWGGKPEDGLAEAELGLAGPCNESRADLAGLHAMRGWAWHRLGRGVDIALAEAWKAVGVNKSQIEAAELIREIGGVRSEGARNAKVTILGKWHEPVKGKQSGFLAYYEVIATSEAEILELVRPFEPHAVRNSLEIQKVTWLEETPNEWIGVTFARSDYSFFPWKR